MAASEVLAAVEEWKANSSSMRIPSLIVRADKDLPIILDVLP